MSNPEHHSADANKMVTGPERAREIALGYVRELLADGYTAARANAEMHNSFHGSDSIGYTIKHGKITVPALGPDKWTFSFSELAHDVETGAGQMMLFT